MSQFVLALVPLLVIFGAINTIQLKLQNLQIVDQATKSKFFHPFMQSLCMFVGEALVGVVLLIQWLANRGKQQPQSEQLQKKPAPAYTVIFPAVMDLLSTLLSYTALNMVDSSVWQISRGGNIITTALLSACFLKRVFHRGAVVGCVMAFLGITGVQLVAVLYANGSDSGQSAQTEIIGILLLVASIVFNSLCLIAEKWIFNKYEISPLKVVFLEGLYGLIVLVPLTFAFQYVSCPWSEQSCVNVDGQLYLQNMKQFWNQITANTLLMVLNFGLILSIGISVPIAVTVSKLISPVSRSLADVCRTVFIWLFGIIMTLTVGVDHEQYKKMQDTRVIVNVLKGVGFVVLIVGTLMYHQLIPLCVRKDAKQHLQSLIQTQPQLQSETGSFSQGKRA